MSQHDDDNKSKVISLFERHHFGSQLKESGGEMIESPDGFHYVSFRYKGKDEAEWHEANELEIAGKRSYIFRILEHHTDTTRVNHYYVPGNRLDEFLKSLPNRPGRLLEIKPFIPDTMA